MSGAQTYNDPVTATKAIAFSGMGSRPLHGEPLRTRPVGECDLSLDLHNSTRPASSGTPTFVNGGALESDGVLHIAGAVHLDGGVLTLTLFDADVRQVTDPNAGKTVAFGFVPIEESSATVQDAGGIDRHRRRKHARPGAPAWRRSISLSSWATPCSGRYRRISKLGDNDATRFNEASGVLTSASCGRLELEIHAARCRRLTGDQTLQQAGLDDVTVDPPIAAINARRSARSPFNNIQGLQVDLDAWPDPTIPPTALLKAEAGGPETRTSTTRCRSAARRRLHHRRPTRHQATPPSSPSAAHSSVKSLRWCWQDLPRSASSPRRTAHAAGNRCAGGGARIDRGRRQAQAEEAVRTENVRSRLRSGVIAEVGAGRPATASPRESIRCPILCEINRRPCCANDNQAPAWRTPWSAHYGRIRGLDLVAAGAGRRADPARRLRRLGTFSSRRRAWRRVAEVRGWPCSSATASIRALRPAADAQERSRP